MPKKIRNALCKLDIKKLYHIRLRIGFSISLLYDSKKVFLSDEGVTLISDKAIKCFDEDIAEIINNVTERSLYAFNEQIKQGYIGMKNGIRIGVAGECVFDNGKIITIKNINGLSLRIPHEILGSANLFVPNIFDGNVVNNSLIVSSPTRGKTTILKDVARQLNLKSRLSILIIDERGEFSEIKGQNIDLIKYSDKYFAFNYAVRSLAPDLIITDELCSIEDWLAVKRCVSCGVNVIATSHGKSVEDLLNKDYFINKVFDRYFFLDAYGLPGQLSRIYDGDFNLV